jgi:transposase InsO family protein
MASDEMMKVYMLCRLPAEYDAVRNALEMRDDESVSVEFVRTRLIEEWRTKQLRGEVDNTSGSVLQTSSSQQLQCYYCKRVGHMKRDCRKFKRDSEAHSWQRDRSGGASSSKANNTKCGSEDESFVFSSSTNSFPADWIVDSGATKHMTYRREFFGAFDPSHRQKVRLADNSVTISEGIGSGSLIYIDEQGQQVTRMMDDVLYVPKLANNLISVPILTGNGFSVTFTGDKCQVQRSGKTILTAKLRSGLFVIENLVQKVAATKTSFGMCVHMWHRVLGHRDIAAIRKLAEKKLALGIEIMSCNCQDECETCLKGKFSRLPFQKSKSTSSAVLDLVHTDVCGPMQTETPGKKRYYLTFIDDFSRYSMVYLLAKKSDVFEKLQDYVALMRNQFGKMPKTLRCDRGTEYTDQRVRGFLKKCGIRLQLTAPYSPQQNGKAERKNRYLTEMARCMIIDAGMPNEFWGEAIVTANYIQNRLPTRSSSITPYEAFFGKKPELSHVRVFGQSAYAMVPKQQRRKLDEKSKKYRLVGYDVNSKAYRLADVGTKKVVVTRDVKFLDSELKTSSNQGDGEVQVIMPTDDTGKLLGEGVDDSGSELYDSADTDVDNTPARTGNDQQLRRSSRATRGVKPARFLMASVAKAVEPRTFEEAMQCPESEMWMHAMEAEMKSITENDTWDLVDLPEGRKAVGSKWVYKIKYSDQEEPIYKARIVARGFSQIYGSDYTDVYAPVAKHTTFRVMLSMAAKRKLAVFHYDAKTAFLNGTLSEEIYMSQPRGFEIPGGETKVCRLKKSLYGLKQAARCWNEALNNKIKDMKFEQSQSDPCLYYNKSGVLLLVYVDDILVFGPDVSAIQHIMEPLMQTFVIKNLGPVSKYLGIEVFVDDNGNYLISQEQYIHQIVSEAGLEDSKFSPFPIDPGYYKLLASPPLETNDVYRRIVGQLLYISGNTRPDIAFSVSLLGRKVENPSQTDFNEAKRVLRYLKGTIHMKLAVSRSEGDQELHCYVDADWAEDATDRKSNSGYLFHLNGGIVSWTSRKQTIVALSTAEAEYEAMCEACKEAVWLRSFLEEMGAKISLPIKMFEDNQACINIVQSESITARNKHMGVRLEYVRALNKLGVIQLVYCPSHIMEADLLTKPLGAVKLEHLRGLLGLGWH